MLETKYHFKTVNGKVKIDVGGTKIRQIRFQKIFDPIVNYILTSGQCATTD